jgi:hypothetical protein
VDSNQVLEKLGIINGNRMHLSSILSLIAKGLNTFYSFAKISKPVFALSLWGIVCRLMRNVLFNPFRIRL